MIPRLDVDRFLRKWLLLGVLLAVTLWFPSTREAHSLCLRWLLHLNGKTIMRVESLYSDFLFTPTARFSPGYKAELRARAARSLDDFALARATEEYEDVPSLLLPEIKSNYKDSPLLPWLVFKATWLAVGDFGTNSVSPATLNKLLPWVRLAEASSPTNGALWQAEALLEFAAQNNQAAVNALQVSATNRNWDAGTVPAFECLVDLYEAAGLSRLDATSAAWEQLPGGFFIPSGNIRHFFDLMTQAVRGSQPQDFSRLFQLLAELRRADWSDRSYYANSFRRFSTNDDLIKAMATQIHTNLPSDWTGMDYQYQKEISQQIFQNYLNRVIDPTTLARFNAQTESFQTEHRLRIQSMMDQNRAQMWSGMHAEIASVLSLLMLILLCAALMFEMVIWRLKKVNALAGKWRRELVFWVLATSVVLFSSGLLAYFLCMPRTVAFNFSLSPESEADPSILPLLILLYGVCVLIFSIWLAWVVWNARRGHYQAGSWGPVRFYALAYLLCILAMAFFRNQFVREICDRLQS